MSNAFQRQDVKYNKLKTEFRDVQIRFGRLEEKSNELEGKINKIFFEQFPIGRGHLHTWPKSKAEGSVDVFIHFGLILLIFSLYTYIIEAKDAHVGAL